MLEIDYFNSDNLCLILFVIVTRTGYIWSFVLIYQKGNFSLSTDYQFIKIEVIEYIKFVIFSFQIIGNVNDEVSQFVVALSKTKREIILIIHYYLYYLELERIQLLSYFMFKICKVKARVVYRCSEFINRLRKTQQKHKTKM